MNSVRNQMRASEALAKFLGDVIGSWAASQMRVLENHRWQVVMFEEQVVIALALSSYRRKHGRYPDILNELVPEYLDSIPDDLFTSDELHYERRKDGYRLYSLGPSRIKDQDFPAFAPWSERGVIITVPSTEDE